MMYTKGRRGGGDTVRDPNPWGMVRIICPGSAPGGRLENVQRLPAMPRGPSLLDSPRPGRTPHESAAIEATTARYKEICTYIVEVETWAWLHGAVLQRRSAFETVDRGGCSHWPGPPYRDAHPLSKIRHRPIETGHWRSHATSIGPDHALVECHKRSRSDSYLIHPNNLPLAPT
eukprot:scaffold819_cov350-Prasinococcus_capsulatus_cf.AAC.16